MFVSSREEGFLLGRLFQRLGSSRRWGVCAQHVCALRGLASLVRILLRHRSDAEASTGFFSERDPQLLSAASGKVAGMLGYLSDADGQDEGTEDAELTPLHLSCFG